MKIMIAEDDFTSRNLLKALLTKRGYEVVAVANGAEAWEAMQNPNAPSMAILDWMMPEIDGLDVCHRIRSVETDRPPYIIMLTSKGEKADIVAGLEAGADDYMSKPYDIEELQARVKVGRRILELQSSLRESRDALAHEATHDFLTNVYNRRALLEILSRELSREQRQQNGLAIGICDIDHFKKINDTHGHLVGDEVLCGLVHILSRNLRPYDFIGRFGGEEFVLITPVVRETDAKILYERLRSAIADNPIPTRVGNMSITISIGVAISKGNEKIDELLAAADTALYEAKSSGRNRMCLAEGKIAEGEQTCES